MKGMLVGGSAAPRAMIAGFKQRHGLDVVHGWGMTETSPVASTAQLPGRARERRRGDAVRLHRDAGAAAAARRAARPRRRRRRAAVGRRVDGRARGARPVGRRRLLRHARAGRPLDRRRLVPHRRRRHDPPARLHPDQGPLEGRDQVGRRVDLVGRARERADGAPGDRGGGGDRGARREVGRAAARRRRARARARPRPPTSCASSWRRTSRSGGCPTRFEFVAEIPKTSVGKFRKTELREMFASEAAPSQPVATS